MDTIINNNDTIQKTHVLAWVDHFNQLSHAKAVKALLALDARNSQLIIPLITTDRLYTLCSELRLPGKISFLKAIPVKERRALLNRFDKKFRSQLSDILACEDPVAEMMDCQLPVFCQITPVKEALDTISSDSTGAFSHGICFIKSKSGRLTGQLPLQALLQAHPDATIASLSVAVHASCLVSTDQESAAMLLQQQQLQILPVLNNKGVMVGLLTATKALSIIQREQTEDIEQLMGISSESVHQTYLETSVISHVKSRVFWIAGLAMVGIISGLIIHSYENVIDAFTILAIYMPMVADTGGNTGSQSATLVVRALALGELKAKQLMHVVWKEFRVATILSIVLAALTFSKVAFLSWDAELPGGISLKLVAVTISLALMLQVITATIIGAVLPIAAKACGQDPAIVASPAITTVVDITGMLIYFYTASTLLGIG